MSSTSPRSIVVTGANKGIGYEAVKQLAVKLPQATIYLTARSQSNGDNAIQKMKKEESSHDFSNVRVVILEILDSSSIQQAVESVKKESGSLDVLLHNSGISSADGDPQSPKVMDVNVRAVKKVIDAFSPILSKDHGKIIVVSSEVATWATDALKPELQEKVLDVKNTPFEQVDAWIDDWVLSKDGKPSKEPWNPTDSLTNGAYCVSKALLNAYLRNYASQPNSFPLAIVCPGYCATDLNNNSGYRSAAQGGESVTWPIFNDFKSGHYYQDGKEGPASRPMSAEFAKLHD